MAKEKAGKAKAEKAEKAERPEKAAAKQSFSPGFLSADKKAAAKQSFSPGFLSADKKAERQRKERPSMEKAAEAIRQRTATKQESWVEFKPNELEQVIVNLANAAHTPSEIGMILRDQYGVPNFKKFAGKPVTKVLEENKLVPEVPHELLALIRKSVKLYKHVKQHKSDASAKHGYVMTVSKIRRLVDFYHKNGKLPPTWRYTPEIAELLVK